MSRVTDAVPLHNQVIQIITTPWQGIAFNLTIIRIDQGGTVETTLVSERSRFDKRSLRFRLSRQTATCASATEVCNTNNMDGDDAIVMMSLKDMGSALLDQDGFAVTPV